MSMIYQCGNCNTQFDYPAEQCTNCNSFDINMVSEKEIKKVRQKKEKDTTPKYTCIFCANTSTTKMSNCSNCDRKCWYVTADGKPPLYEMVTTWEMPEKLPDLEILLKSHEIGFDTETRDPDLLTKGPSWFRGGGYIVGPSLAWWEDGKVTGIYLPIAHAEGPNLNKQEVIDWLSKLFETYTGTMVLMNAMYDLGWCKVEGVSELNKNATLRDVMAQEALLDEHKGYYNLASLLKTYKLPPKDETELDKYAQSRGLNPKSDLWMFPARVVADYAIRDAIAVLDVYNKQKPLIKAQNLEDIVALEHSIIPCLVAMRFKGVRVDAQKAQELFEKFSNECIGYEIELQKLTGRHIDIWSAESCAAACDQFSIEYTTTKTGKPSITDEWLNSQTHPVPLLISKARKSYKNGHTFCKGMVLDHMMQDGRIHAEFNPLRTDEGGTVSGRFSSSRPNLQQVPARDPVVGTLIRSLFLPEEGELWAAIDYSSQEPRLTVHFAAERECTRGNEVAEKYNQDPNTDYHSVVAEMTGLKRKDAKTINLGLAYGMGGAKLCKSLGFPTVIVEKYGKQIEMAGEQGREVLDKYNKEMPFIKELANQYGEIARKFGQIRTLAGRLCRFPYYGQAYGNKAFLGEAAAREYFGPKIQIERAYTHSALNRKIQGSAADLMKIAMRNLYQAGFIPAVTVHDEIGVSVKSIEEANMIRDIMNNCVNLLVPLKCDIDIGRSWGEAKPVVEDEQ